MWPPLRFGSALNGSAITEWPNASPARRLRDRGGLDRRLSL